MGAARCRGVWQPWVVLKRPIVVAGLTVVGLLLASCAMTRTEEAVPGQGNADEWVVVTYADTEAKFSTHSMDALEETELEADEALSEAGLGMIDGNEIGDHSYQLFFAGSDRHRMWGVLEPILEKAPIRWSRVELFTSIDKTADEVILPR